MDTLGGYSYYWKMHFSLIYSWKLFRIIFYICYKTILKYTMGYYQSPNMRYTLA